MMTDERRAEIAAFLMSHTPTYPDIETDPVFGALCRALRSKLNAGRDERNEEQRAREEMCERAAVAERMEADTEALYAEAIKRAPSPVQAAAHNPQR